jgi:hypothetical protein
MSPRAIEGQPRVPRSLASTMDRLQGRDAHVLKTAASKMALGDDALPHGAVVEALLGHTFLAVGDLLNTQIFAGADERGRHTLAEDDFYDMPL